MTHRFAHRALYAGMLALAIAAAPFSANAQSFDSSHGDWSVFTLNSGSTCYIASAPVKKTGNYSRRGDPYVLITSRGPDLDEVSVSSGYPYKSGAKVKVEVDSNSFEFFVKDEIAWAYDEAADRKVVQLMKAGSRMSVRGTSQKDTYSQDTYSLKGVTKAYHRMKELCK